MGTPSGYARRDGDITRYYSKSGELSAVWTPSDIQNVQQFGSGTSTHNQLDTHHADTTVHYTQSAINHNNLLNKGTTTHTQLDTHYADTTVHYTQTAINHLNLQNRGSITHGALDTRYDEETRGWKQTFYTNAANTWYRIGNRLLKSSNLPKHILVTYHGRATVSEIVKGLFSASIQSTHVTQLHRHQIFDGTYAQQPRFIVYQHTGGTATNDINVYMLTDATSSCCYEASHAYVSPDRGFYTQGSGALPSDISGEIGDWTLRFDSDDRATYPQTDYFRDPVNITNNASSTDPTSGALVIAGGLGLAENLNIGAGGSIVSNNLTNATSVNTGAIRTLGGIGVAQDLWCSGLCLPAPAGIPTLIDFYEEFALNTTVSGPWASSIAIVFPIWRLGRLVSFNSFGEPGGNATNAAIITAAGALPARFRPTSFKTFLIRIMDNSTFTIGTLRITDAGVITIGLGYDPDGVFTAANQAILYHISVSYQR